MAHIASSVERVPYSRIRELAEIAMQMDGVLRLYFALVMGQHHSRHLAFRMLER